MEVDRIGILERIAQYGTAPSDGCHLFGVGFEDAFERIRVKYLVDRFSRGGSAEKFVIGPFGSGKTHFLRELMEIARSEGCVTAEIQLTKELDVTDNLSLYREVVQELRIPNQPGTGAKAMLRGCLERVRASVEEGGLDSDELVGAWIEGLEEKGFKLEAFRRVVQVGLRALMTRNDARLEASCRWIAGDMSDASVAKDLGESVIRKADQNLTGKRALLSLFQFIRASLFQGTVVGYDEAEQGMNVDRRRREKLLSLLQSDINAIADLQNGAALVLYAVTPDIIEKMEEFAALQQRVSDPASGRGFFDGNTLATKIDLRERQTEPEKELADIGHHLCLLVKDEPDLQTVGADALQAHIVEMAQSVAMTEADSSSRRTMAKRTSEVLLHLLNGGTLDDFAPSETVPQDDEF